MRALLHRHSELLLMAADISDRVGDETALVWHHVQENAIRRWCTWHANDISAFFERSTTIKPPDSLWAQRAKFSIIFLSFYVTLFPLMKANYWTCSRFLYNNSFSVYNCCRWADMSDVFVLPQQEDVFMSLFDTLRSSLHKLRSVVAVLILNSYEHTHPWRSYLISPSHPCSDVKQHFDPGEHVMAGWVVPACKEQNLQICFVFSHGPTVIRLLPFQKTTTWPWKTSTCVYLNVAFAFKCNTRENAWFFWERDCI